jgi:hypothetical protein
MGWFRKDPNEERVRAALKEAIDFEKRYNNSPTNHGISAKQSAEALRAAEIKELQARSRYRLKTIR